MVQEGGSAEKRAGTGAARPPLRSPAGEWVLDSRGLQPHRAASAGTLASGDSAPTRAPARQGKPPRHPALHHPGSQPQLTQDPGSLADMFTIFFFFPHCSGS
ncbi:unnamed protein product [Rangifer tarandus platyrhynchus]|uniref:Uncharacterized protein n=1 Tax=Rangifer tarandus platyrhynchus TaxID=3082113 RepID=A0ABN8YEN5_RANTA|nr:unnamed protein product [Rangifer tarandus platyrhynchus]